MMSQPNFRTTNTYATRHAIRSHRYRTESNSIRALQESINFHRSLLCLPPRLQQHDLSLDIEEEVISDAERDELKELTDKDIIRQRKALINDLKRELADLIRRVDEKAKSQKVKLRSDDKIKEDVASSMKPQDKPLLNSLFASLIDEDQGWQVGGASDVPKRGLGNYKKQISDILNNARA